ncbi:MAG: hypothetical protein Ct9H300mP27_05570 [Chloroflexota bacterium]|nr:MAG: hypothetical protein Ct9H300mP27_05570 [Chloroflexota bacterium]
MVNDHTSRPRGRRGPERAVRRRRVRTDPTLAYPNGVTLTGILSDIQVIELTHGASGSFCAKLLADQGADTIKVEPPGWGDTARHEPPFVNGPPTLMAALLFSI